MRAEKQTHRHTWGQYRHTRSNAVFEKKNSVHGNRPLNGSTCIWRFRKDITCTVNIVCCRIALRKGWSKCVFASLVNRSIAFLSSCLTVPIHWPIADLLAVHATEHHRTSTTIDVVYVKRMSCIAEESETKRPMPNLLPYAWRALSLKPQLKMFLSIIIFWFICLLKICIVNRKTMSVTFQLSSKMK